jgi:2-methylcitrate dehydratase
MIPSARLSFHARRFLSAGRSLPPLSSSAHRTRAPAFPLGISGVLYSPARTMSSHRVGESTHRPEADQVLRDIADYVHSYKVESDLAFETARLCLIDTIGCGLEALRFPECARLLGPVVEGTVVPNGADFN